MNFAPMQLTRLWIEQLEIEANPSFEPVAGTLGVPWVGFEKVTLQRSGQSPVFRLLLTVRVPTSDAPSGLIPIEVPYRVTIRAAAEISFFPDAGLDDAAMERLIAFNGLAALYAFARDAVHQVTAQGQHGALLLPVFNISEVSKSLLQQIPAVGHARETSEG